MFYIICIFSLVGQFIILYFQKKGYLEIVLQFVQDFIMCFDLVIECGNFDVVVEMVKEFDKFSFWICLSFEVFVYGNYQVVEMCYQKLKQFDKLFFLYLVIGDYFKFVCMVKIVEYCGDFILWFQNVVYFGEVEDCIQMFKEIDFCKFFLNDLFDLKLIRCRFFGVYDC